MGSTLGILQCGLTTASSGSDRIPWGNGGKRKNNIDSPCRAPRATCPLTGHLLMAQGALLWDSSRRQTGRNRAWRPDRGKGFIAGRRGLSPGEEVYPREKGFLPGGRGLSPEKEPGVAAVPEPGEGPCGERGGAGDGARGARRRRVMAAALREGKSRGGDGP